MCQVNSDDNIGEMAAPVLKARQPLGLTSLLLARLQDGRRDPCLQLRDLHRLLPGEVTRRQSWTCCQGTKLRCWLLPKEISANHLKYLKCLKNSNISNICRLLTEEIFGDYLWGAAHSPAGWGFAGWDQGTQAQHLSNAALDFWQPEIVKCLF